jgi:hypothetical protein
VVGIGHEDRSISSYPNKGVSGEISPWISHKIEFLEDFVKLDKDPIEGYNPSGFESKPKRQNIHIFTIL